MTPQLSHTPVLKTERLTLRAFAPQDVEQGARYLTDRRTIYMGGPYSPADAWDHCAALIGHWAIHGFGVFSLCLKGSDTAIGDCGLLRPYGYPENELGWGIWDTALEGKSLVREAAEAVRAYAFGALGWSTLVSYINPQNARSIALAKRLGCTLDKAATLPDLPGWEDTLGFRHVGPEALS